MGGLGGGGGGSSGGGSMANPVGGEFGGSSNADTGSGGSSDLFDTNAVNSGDSAATDAPSTASYENTGAAQAQQQQQQSTTPASPETTAQGGQQSGSSGGGGRTAGHPHGLIGLLSMLLGGGQTGPPHPSSGAPAGSFGWYSTPADGQQYGRTGLMSTGPVGGPGQPPAQPLAFGRQQSPANAGQPAAPGSAAAPPTAQTAAAPPAAPAVAPTTAPPSSPTSTPSPSPPASPGPLPAAASDADPAQIEQQAVRPAPELNENQGNTAHGFLPWSPQSAQISPQSGTAAGNNSTSAAPAQPNIVAQGQVPVAPGPVDKILSGDWKGGLTDLANEFWGQKKAENPNIATPMDVNRTLKGDFLGRTSASQSKPPPPSLPPLNAGTLGTLSDILSKNPISGGTPSPISRGTAPQASPVPQGRPGGVDPQAPPSGPQYASAGDPRGMKNFIAYTARKYGIDPNVAVRVAGTEGLASFPSGIPGERSYGAFQLYTQGGMGNDFKRDTGLDASNPANERAATDYALARASKEGWGAFHGAANSGIGQWAGINRGSTAPAYAPTPAPATGFPAQPPAASPARIPSYEQWLQQRGLPNNNLTKTRYNIEMGLPKNSMLDQVRQRQAMMMAPRDQIYRATTAKDLQNHPEYTEGGALTPIPTAPYLSPAPLPLPTDRRVPPQVPDWTLT